MTKDSTSSCEKKTCEPQNILEFDPPTISTLIECISQPHPSVDEISPNAPDADLVESCSEAYFRCLGQLRNYSEKFTDIVSSGTNGSLIHYGLAFTEVKELCKQCSFSPVWHKVYPHLEYSISKDNAYCYVCSLFREVWDVRRTIQHGLQELIIGRK